MLLDQYDAVDLYLVFYDDWRRLISFRATADGLERELLNQGYARVSPYVGEIEAARS